MLSITLDRPDSFAPGETISGITTWTELAEKTKRIEIRLIWYTEGKGDTDVEIIDMVPVEQPNTAGETKFSFVAPNRPYSFSGKLISLIWAIEVVEFPSQDGEKVTLAISPTRTEIVLDKEFEDDRTKLLFRFSR